MFFLVSNVKNVYTRSFMSFVHDMNHYQGILAKFGSEAIKDARATAVEVKLHAR